MRLPNRNNPIPLHSVRGIGPKIQAALGHESIGIRSVQDLMAYRESGSLAAQTLSERLSAVMGRSVSAERAGGFLDRAFEMLEGYRDDPRYAALAESIGFQY